MSTQFLVRNCYVFKIVAGSYFSIFKTQMLKKEEISLTLLVLHIKLTENKFKNQKQIVRKKLNQNICVMKF